MAVAWVEPIESMLQACSLVSFDLAVVKAGCIVSDDQGSLRFAMKVLAYPLFMLILAIWMVAMGSCG